MDTTQRILVLLHIFGAIIFVGNIMVSAMWMTAAKRTRDKTVLYYAARTVQRADFMFTVPGVLLLLIPGLILVGYWGGFGGTGWAEAALALFLMSGIVWAAILLPLQGKMIRLGREAVELGMALDETFYRLLRRWNMWGGIATLLPLVSLYLMVFKPALWAAG